MNRHAVVHVLLIVLLILNIGLMTYLLIVSHQPFTEYCDWVQPGKVLTCHR